MARKLFARMEDDEVMVQDSEELMNDVVEQQEDEATVTEIVDDIQQDIEELKEAIDAGESVEKTEEIVADAVENDEPLDATSAALVQESLNVLYQRTGFKTKRVIASMESYSGSRTDRMQATKQTLVALEEVKEAFWLKIKRFFANLWTSVSSFFVSLFSKKKAMAIRVKRLVALAEAGTNVKTDAKISVSAAVSTSDKLKKETAKLVTVTKKHADKLKEVEALVKTAKDAYKALSDAKTVDALASLETATKAVEDATFKPVEEKEVEKVEATVTDADISDIKAAAANVKEAFEVYEKTGKTEKDVADEKKADEAQEADLEKQVNEEAKEGAKPAAEADSDKVSIMKRASAWWKMNSACKKAVVAVEKEMYKSIVAGYSETAKYVSTLRTAKSDKK